ncbi:hydroxymyristoyl-ACP dehydratase [Bacillus sp. SA1-12]|uniref:DNA-directed RNA polymerase subunit beta n=1 Tax=Bacillus sp. SA1-12 TaxID=1455638 RepID=UPI0006270C78|nr:DNA-directed RNA polymerase subunit beta [Bacillus sp. SA1-12]KKI89718.1 hydroxymyristoyl-ACP dehydratase [Bacillus sp. SA1-12]
MVEKQAAKAASREEVKKAKKTKDKQQEKVKIRVRLIPIWLRVLLVLIFMAISAIVGIIVGYGVIGTGDPSDALDQSTWQHIIDLVEKE